MDVIGCIHRVTDVLSERMHMQTERRVCNTFFVIQQDRGFYPLYYIPMDLYYVEIVSVIFKVVSFIFLKGNKVMRFYKRSNLQENFVHRDRV